VAVQRPLVVTKDVKQVGVRPADGAALGLLHGSRLAAEALYALPSFAPPGFRHNQNGLRDEILSPDRFCSAILLKDDTISDERRDHKKGRPGDQA
jgi:hypothetical protein